MGGAVSVVFSAVVAITSHANHPVLYSSLYLLKTTKASSCRKVKRIAASKDFFFLQGLCCFNGVLHNLATKSCKLNIYVKMSDIITSC